MAGFRSVGVYVPHHVGTLELALVTQLFADRSEQGLPPFAISLCTTQPSMLTTDIGATIPVRRDLGLLREVDLVVSLPGRSFEAEPPVAVLDALRAAHRRGAIIASERTGSYAVAAAGLLDGKAATVHWRNTLDFARRFPAVRVKAQALYVDEGSIVTGAGGAAGLDMYLHLLRREHGAAVARVIARELISGPHRDGSHAQYLEDPLPADHDDDRLADVLAWMTANPTTRVSVDHLAARALMSPRTFARRFKSATGATPTSWLLNQRLARAEELLETTNLPVGEVAHAVGYASGAVLRQRFARHRGISPQAYRRRVTATRLVD
jgi:transcriptional regulator GlxA family with amidase domain